jgi:hypothetical protein
MLRTDDRFHGNGDMVRPSSVDDRAQPPVGAYALTPGWSTAVTYRIRGDAYLLLLRARGVGPDGKNANIHRLADDGTIGVGVDAYQWSEGWTSAVHFMAVGKAYLLFVKRSGYGGDGNNVHIHQVNDDGTVGAQVAAYKRSEGWSTALSYTIAGEPFVLFLRASGYDADGSNVHVHAVGGDGSIGKLVHRYRWDEGWPTGVTYVAGGVTMLLILRSAGHGADGYNVHVHRLQGDGGVGARVAAYKWTDGWGIATSYTVGQTPYLLALRYGSDPLRPNNARVCRLGSDGVQDGLESYRWPEGWTYAQGFSVDSGAYVLLLREDGYDADGNNAYVLPVSDGGRIRATRSAVRVARERELSYQVSAHYHPFVSNLAERLVTTSVAGLQAADTEPDRSGSALPGSIEVDLGPNTQLPVAGSVHLALLKDTIVSMPDGTEKQLAAHLQVTASAPAQLTLPAGLRLSLVGDLGMKPAPKLYTTLTVAVATAATAVRSGGATLAADTGIMLPGDEKASVTLTAATECVVGVGTDLVLPAGTTMTVRSIVPRPALYKEIFTTDAYNPTAMVRRPYPARELDFSASGAYSVYNWELFYHAPLTIAIHLSKNQRFAEAQRWLHYVFDPTDDSDGPTPGRFWKVRPFQYADVLGIEHIMVNLATGADPRLRAETIRSIEAWKNHPFRPHVIARFRQQAFMFKAVMAYLDNLIAWGDALFRQDTGESIDEALVIYVLARNILGPRPQAVPRKGTVRPQTYANLRADLDKFGNAMRDMETALPFDLAPFPTDTTANGDRLAAVRSMGRALYFCVPRNDKLLDYWNTVDDRLFKIRNSLNIQGVFRQLPLFEPPIDPAMLARAAAAGLDVSAIVNGLNQPLPLVRCQILIQKASEIAQEVKSLGANLLSAMEKEDGEAMAILRAKHERVVMGLVEHVKYGQLQEAIKAREGLLQTLAQAVQRYVYYERQLGRQADEIAKAVPALDDLDRAALTRMKVNLQEPSVPLRDLPVDIAADLGASGGKVISSHEREELTRLQEARELSEQAGVKDKIAAGLSLLPELSFAFEFWGIGGNLTFGGSALSRGMSFWASFAKSDAEKKTYESGNATRIGSYARREQDWAFQSNLAAGEITQIFKQLRAAQIREAVAELELANHRQQMAHAEEIDRFMNEGGVERTGKKTNKALYAWMKREARGLFSQTFQFAFDIAKKAERALQHELGNPQVNYVQFSYLSGKEGLLAGEKLHLDVKRMEMAYHDLNHREYEMTKHVSLLQVDPLALMQLRATGRCVVQLPEGLFDLDCPGQYFRRIKTVALSIPCVTGPYAGVNCRVTLLKSSVRTSTALGDGVDVYARQGADDGRFSDHFGTLESIVTSSGQNDAGMFETNLRDERYLPFEYSGVVSEWQLELPANPARNQPAQFDYDTISDVIMHVRYTAREGGDLLRNAASAHLADRIAAAEAAGSARLFSIRHEFPGAWADFANRAPTDTNRHELHVGLRAEHYPYWSRGRLNRIESVEFMAHSKDPKVASVEVFRRGVEADKGPNDPAPPPYVPIGTLARDATVGNLLRGPVELKDLLLVPVGDVKAYLDTNRIEDLCLIVKWGDRQDN